MGLLRKKGVQGFSFIKIRRDRSLGAILIVYDQIWYTGIFDLPRNPLDVFPEPLHRQTAIQETGITIQREQVLFLSRPKGRRYLIADGSEGGLVHI